MLVVLVDDVGATSRLLEDLIDVLGVEVVLTGREFRVQGLHYHCGKGLLTFVVAEGALLHQQLNGAGSGATDQLRETSVIGFRFLFFVVLVTGQLVGC